MSATKATGVAVSAALAGLGALHVVWTVTPWPLRTPEEFADTVVGAGDGLPPAAACLAVAGLLGAGAYLVAAEAGVLPPAGPRRLRRAGVRAVSGVMLARGIGGLALFGNFVERSERFTRLDSRYYSPLCLALGAGAAVIAGAGVERRSQ
ncbi:DUF3995 domain-containing protein [Kitasatospora sp. NPDC093558]|uniref:DUF3995 domain-containing protein n=1 Tax=Kitasatospora sp. NPDC093558 TaxID=3155201 RepID=UPI003417C986